MKNPLYIWGEQIPGNNKRLKTDVLNIHEEYTPHDLFEKYPGVWDKSSDELGDLSGNDTMVYRQEIEHGPAEITYTDRPFLSSLSIGRERPGSCDLSWWSLFDKIYGDGRRTNC